MGNESKIDFYFNQYNERDWGRFVQCFNEVEIPDDINDKIPNDVVKVLIGLLGIESMKKWIVTELKQLDFNSAITLSKTYKGLKALKALIIRMPN